LEESKNVVVYRVIFLGKEVLVSKKIIALFLLALIALAGYHAYNKVFFNSVVATEGQENITEICDPSVEDCSGLEDNLDM